MTTPSIETSIWLALKARMQTLALNPTLPIAWPNESFEPVGTYLRVTHLPNINRRITFGSTDPQQRLSLLQIDVFAPLNQNIAIVTEIAGKVAQHFHTDLRMSSNGVVARVRQAPIVGPSLSDGKHIMLPVTINIEVFA